MTAVRPHFALPFRYVDGAPVVNEQDSTKDVLACVEAVLITNPGEHENRPDFGMEDPSFEQQPPDVNAIVRAIERFEPRARAVADAEFDALHETVARVRINLDTTGA